MTNVIAFPRGKKDSPPQRIEEVVDRVNTFKRDYAETVVSLVMGNTLQFLEEEGIDPASVMPQDVALFSEAAKALVYKAMDLDHPFQHVANSLFLVEDNNGAVTVKFNTELFEEAPPTSA